MTSLTGSGFKQLETVGLRLKIAADRGLRNSLRAEIKAAAAPLINDVRQAARDELPKAGGLNEWVSGGKFKTSAIFTGANTGIRIAAVAHSSKRSGTRQFGTDRGTFRHPVFGHTDRSWVEQKLRTPGWFTETLKHKAPEKMVPAVRAALQATAESITLGV